MIDALQSFSLELLESFVQPQKRVFWGYLACAGIIALLWCRFIRHQSVLDALRTIFDRRAWWSKSARTDYKVMAVNSVVVPLIAPKLISQAAVAYILFGAMHGIFSGRPMMAAQWPDWTIMAAFTATLFITDDFARYVVHRLLHRVPALWAFHKIHHSATSLNPLTIFRTHPVEGVLFIARNALVQGACIGIFVFFFGERVGLVTIIGANAFNFMFNALGSNLRHSHIPIRYWPAIERVLISPAQHQIHHSIDRKHHDKNFGVVLAVWDLAFGTHCFSEPNQKLSYGLDADSDIHNRNLSSVYVGPLRESAAAINQALALVARRSLAFLNRVSAKMTA